MYSLRPEPDPAEHDALVSALERLIREEADGVPSVYRSEWRNAALEEGVSPEEPEC